MIHWCRRSLIAIGASLVVTLVVTTVASADVFRPAYLELKQRDADTYDVVWKVPTAGETMRMAIHVRFPDGTVALTQARATVASGAVIERWTIHRPGGLGGGEIAIDGLPGSVTDVLARVERSDGTTQVTRLLPSAPRFTVEGAHDAASVSLTYTRLGVQHILEGVDHLLFVLALLLIVGRLQRLAWTITAFTVAHSLTLAAATLGLVHVSQAPVEAAIALSIMFVAAETVHGLQGRLGLTARAPWVVAFVFGLLHGFGFAGALAEVGLPERAIPVALLFFNVGVELGQLLFVAVAWWALLAIRRLPAPWPTGLVRASAYAIGSVAMFWVVERVSAFGL